MNGDREVFLYHFDMWVKGSESYGFLGNERCGVIGQLIEEVQVLYLSNLWVKGSEISDFLSLFIHQCFKLKAMDLLIWY
ncbi:hypothetical protein O6P43_002619 [Quillaja saponaria]|uniref:Uncharacterized protein n=1 Tax=Quillaja saponaria TaxID=32244 RepID=A0AAD7VKP4_QUISA|nr:hypothetical protein O6P43_002619 [Quillaja saponaria]